MASHRNFVVLVVLIVFCSAASSAKKINVAYQNQPPSGPQVVASPSVLPTSLTNITISWSGIESPSDLDFLAIYSPSNASNYIGYHMLNESLSWMEGNGSITVSLVNMRKDYGFAVWGNQGKEVIAVSNAVSFENINEPLQGHLALTNDPTQVIVMWVTAENETVPTVEFGTASGAYTNSATGISYTYTIEQMCTAPANTTEGWQDPGFIHEVLITGLSTSTMYYYRFGNATTGWSPEYSFITSPGADPTASVQLIAFGDLGVAPPFLSDLEQQYPSVKTAHWIYQDILELKKAGEATAVVHIGDISYARGYAYLWDYFFSLIQPAATSAPYMVAIGNHEYDWLSQPYLPSFSPYHNDSGGECGVPYSERFHMPNPDPQGSYGQRNLWYSFDFGPIHFVFMSTEHNFTTGSDQWNWIVNDLNSVSRDVTPWLVFSGHRPMYTTSTTSEQPFEAALRESYEPLFQKYDVDVALWGHVHAYERSCGMFDKVCAPSDNDAPVHFTIGAAGNTFQTGWASTDGGHVLQPNWLIFRTMNYGYARIFANATHFNLNFHGDQRNELHDSTWLTK
eukprot:TRINITY_DN690_c0_g1_i1.p1 TRINITY_DN690_c0_g1~~TRINITY_DN690_c0_g1_i1.p1  ORF type:complete len:567 (+),score=113.94 TRINITY_DN690_c0_g1_i1:106-1806(+)